jgi:hypothetical protein
VVKNSNTALANGVEEVAVAAVPVPLVVPLEIDKVAFAAPDEDMIQSSASVPSKEGQEPGRPVEQGQDSESGFVGQRSVDRSH